MWHHTIGARLIKIGFFFKQETKTHDRNVENSQGHCFPGIAPNLIWVHIHRHGCVGYRFPCQDRATLLYSPARSFTRLLSLVPPPPPPHSPSPPSPLPRPDQCLESIPRRRENGRDNFFVCQSAIEPMTTAIVSGLHFGTSRMSGRSGGRALQGNAHRFHLSIGFSFVPSRALGSRA